MPRAEAVTVTIRGEDAALLRARAAAKDETPEAFVLRVLRKDAAQSERMKAAWARPGRREVMSVAIKAGWAKAKAMSEATPEASSNGRHD